MTDLLVLITKIGVSTEISLIAKKNISFADKFQQDIPMNLILPYIPTSFSHNQVLSNKLNRCRVDVGSPLNLHLFNALIINL